MSKVRELTNEEIDKLIELSIKGIKNNGLERFIR